MAQIFKNNTWGTLASQLTAGATTATLSAGHGFTDPGADWYLATLIGVTGTTETAWEIVKVTDVSTNTLTIVRAQEGTTAVTWPVGTRLELRLTAGATESKANLGAAAYKTVGTGSSDVAAGDHAHASLYQPLDSDLTALAGLSTTGLIERTGAGAAAIVTVTAAGKALLDDADAAAQRTTLGLGAIYAPLASPALTGTPTAPTATQGDNDTSIATTAFVNAEIAADAVPVSFLTSQIGMRNKLINGAFDIWQRGSSRAGATSFTDSYVSDRWVGVRGPYAAGMTVSKQAAGLAGFQYCARVQRNPGDTSLVGIDLEQSLETGNSVFAQGVPVTMSFYARKGAGYSATASALTVQLFSGKGIDQNSILSGFANYAVIVNQAATLSGSWQRFTYTATPAADITQLAARLNMTPTGTAGESDYFEVTGVQLEAGAIATPFEHRPIGLELALCQRYYVRFTNATRERFPIYARTANTDGRGTVIFPVSMRIPPTAMEVSGVATDYYVDLGGQTLPCAFLPIYIIAGETSCNFDWRVAATYPAGAAGVLYFQTTGGFFGFSAEL